MGYIVFSLSPDVESGFYRHGQPKPVVTPLWIASYRLTTALGLANPNGPFLHGGVGGFHHKLCVRGPGITNH